jgi:hypothetical protein
MAHIQEWGKLAINLPGTHRLARVEKPKLPSCGRITRNPHLTRRWPFGRVTEGLPTNQELTGVESFGHISEKPVLRPSGKLPHCPSSA